MTNTQLVNYLHGTLQNAGTNYYADSSSGQDIDVRPTQVSPVVDQGAALSSEYKYDLMGIDQTLFGDDQPASWHNVPGGPDWGRRNGSDFDDD